MKLTLGRVAFLQILAIALIGAIALSAIGCAPLAAAPSDQQQRIDAARIVDAVNAAKATVDGLKAEARQLQEQARAATQPIVVKPSNDTQPATTVPAPKEVVNAAAKIDEAAGKVAEAMTKLDKYIAAAGTVATETAKPDASIGSVGTAAVQASIPFIPPPYQGYAALGLIAISLVDNIAQRIKAAKAKAAAQANTDALSLAIANKQITVTPAAVPAVDAIVKDHPIGDRLVDVVAGAAK